MSTAKIVKLSSKAQITLPKAAREAIGVGPGDSLAMVVRDGEVVLVSVEEYARQTQGILRGAWGGNRAEIDDYLKKERKSWRRK